MYWFFKYTINLYILIYWNLNISCYIGDIAENAAVAINNADEIQEEFLGFKDHSGSAMKVR